MTATTVMAGLAVAAAAWSVAGSVRAHRAAGGDTRAVVLAAGALLALALVAVDGRAVLGWSFGIGAGEARVLLPGVGVFLGAAFLAATGGTLLLGGGLAAPTAGGGAAVARGLLWAAVAAGAAGVGLAVVRLLSLTAEARVGGAWPVALVTAATAGLALSLVVAGGAAPSDPAREAAKAGLAARAALALALGAAVASGLESWWRDGTYATGLTAAASASALLGLAALEPVPRLSVALRVLFLVALLGLLAG